MCVIIGMISSYNYDMAVKSANHSKDRLGKCTALNGYQYFPSFWLYCAALPDSCGLILIWDYQSALMLIFPLRRGPSLSEASVLLVQAPCLRQGVHQLPSLLSVLSSWRWLCCHTSTYRNTAKLHMQGLLWTTPTWLSFENPWEFFVQLSRERF